MTGIFCFRRSVFLLLGLAGTSMATPPQVIRADEKFFGSGTETYAVLRTVTDNKGSYYRSQSTTKLIERKKTTGEMIRETVMLDREEITDAEYVGPGKLPVNIVIHAKDEKESLGMLLERWPSQGTRTDPAELKRFKVHTSGIRYDGRLELMKGNPYIANLKAEGLRFSDWGLVDGLETADSIFLKAIRADNEGDSDAVWMTVSPEVTAQVHAFRKILPVYLSLGSSADRAEALELAREASTILKEAKFASQETEIWRTEQGGSPLYRVVMTGSNYVIKNGKVEELDKITDIQVVPISSDGFLEWISATAN
jgi:hypothetical protein